MIFVFNKGCLPSMLSKGFLLRVVKIWDDVGIRVKHLQNYKIIFVAFVKVFCAKPKKVNPVTLNFLTTNKCFNSTLLYIYIDNRVLK